MDANGTIRTREVNVPKTSWTDYVFDPGYKLISILVVEAFITKYDHLFNVISEKGVLKNGVNLLEKNEKLLEKG